ncbi:MAG: complex I subunit 5 family protein [Gammaproteobacteria bacterium]|nr:complex I subunit 5 family protein [Gammaproteobacteria bacterium]
MLLLAAIAVPLLCALLAFRGRPAWLLRGLMPAAVLPALSLAVTSNGDEALALPYLFYGAVWSLDELRRLFLLLTAVLWGAAGLYAAGYMGSDRLRRYCICWLLTLAGNLGLILSADLPGFYAFFALMTFAAYGLVVHDGDRPSRHAGRVYLIMALLGEMLLLVGLLLASRAAGSLMLADLPPALAAAPNGPLMMGLLWLGFGVKAGLPLLHFWLPLAHPVAPAPASAVLSGAMIKAGLLGWLLVLPLGEPIAAYWGMLIAAVGAIAALGGAAIGLCQRTPKAVLAYSSISQMGLMTVLLAAALGEPRQAAVLVTVIALYALHHGLAKGALFLATGVKLPANAGSRMLVWILVVLPALSLAGLPFTSGAVAKLLAKSALPPSPWWGVVLTTGAVATTLLALRFLHCMRGSIKEGTNPQWVAPGWLLCTGAALLGVWWMPWTTTPGWDAAAILGLILPAWGKAWSLAWPLAAGGLIGGAAWRIGRRPPPIPSGDGIVWFAALTRYGAGSAKRAAAYMGSIGPGAVDWMPWTARLEHLQRWGEIGDDGACREAGLVFLVFAALIAALLFW